MEDLMLKTIEDAEQILEQEPGFMDEDLSDSSANTQQGGMCFCVCVEFVHCYKPQLASLKIGTKSAYHSNL